MTARACQARAKLGGQARLTSMRRPDGIISPAGKDTTDESYKRREPFSGEVNIAVERSSLGPAIAVVRQHASIPARSEEHTSELQSLMRISYAVFCLKKKNINNNQTISIMMYITS